MPTLTRGRVGRILLASGFLLIAIVVLRWQAALAYLGGYLVDVDPPQTVDLILVLGGDFWGPRVIEAAELAKRGYAPVVLLSSPPYAGRPEGELTIPFLVQKGYPSDDLQVFAHAAKSTIAEANILRGEFARRGAKRVILVTSNYHSRRAATMFRLFCPGIHFISVPAPDPQYHVDGWWNEAGSRQLFFSEWTKILGSVLIAYPRYLAGRWAAFLRRSAIAHVSKYLLADFLGFRGRAPWRVWANVWRSVFSPLATCYRYRSQIMLPRSTSTGAHLSSSPARFDDTARYRIHC